MHMPRASSALCKGEIGTGQGLHFEAEVIYAQGKLCTLKLR
jgi:hypothetical protein